MTRIIGWYILLIQYAYTESMPEAPRVVSCFSYNSTACAVSKARNKSETEISESCGIHEKKCHKYSKDVTVCMAVWRKNAYPLTKATNSLNQGPIYLLDCFDKTYLKFMKCSRDCIAYTSSKDVFASCCCTANLCNGIHNLTMSPYELLDENDNPDYLHQELQSRMLVIVMIVVSTVIMLVVTGSAILILLAKLKLPDYKAEISKATYEKFEFKDSIQFVQELSHGSHARVYICQYNNQQIAAKVFSEENKNYWANEKTIFEMDGMGHDYIVKYFGYFCCKDGLGSRLAVLVEFYPVGSLYDYLKAHILEKNIMLKLAYTFMDGLAYLHGTNSSKAWSVAHRDLKSRNILIRSDFSAVIADFSLAVCFKNGLSLPDNLVQVGTPRYMAPEILDGAISYSRTSFFRIDVYASALVLWELLTRCSMSGSAVYKLPFDDELEARKLSSACPLSFHTIVCREKRRPTFSEFLSNETEAIVMKTLIEESWDLDAEARLTASCIRARLRTLLDSGFSED